MVSGDAPMSAFLPVRFHQEFLSVLNDLKFGDTSSLSTVKDYCSELHQLLKACLYVTHILKAMKPEKYLSVLNKPSFAGQTYQPLILSVNSCVPLWNR